MKKSKLIVPIVACTSLIPTILPIVSCVNDKQHISFRGEKDINAGDKIIITLDQYDYQPTDFRIFLSGEDKNNLILDYDVYNWCINVYVTTKSSAEEKDNYKFNLDIKYGSKWTNTVSGFSIAKGETYVTKDEWLAAYQTDLAKGATTKTGCPYQQDNVNIKYISDGKESQYKGYLSYDDDEESKSPCPHWNYVYFAETEGGTTTSANQTTYTYEEILGTIDSMPNCKFIINDNYLGLVSEDENMSFRLDRNGYTTYMYFNEDGFVMEEIVTYHLAN